MLRSIGSPVQGYTLTARDRRIELQGDQPYPPLRLALDAAEGAFTIDDYAIGDVRYLLEEHRGYEPSGPLWSPGYFRAELGPGRDVTLIASTESWETLSAMKPADASRRSTTGVPVSSPPPIRPPTRAPPPSSCSPPTSSSSGRQRGPTTRRARGPAAARRARSSPATTGSPTGAATR